MFKRLGVFGLMLAAAATALIQPATAFGQDRYDRGNRYAYHDRDDHREYRGDRDYDRGFRGHEWREREERAQAWREHEWHERERWQDRGYRYNYAPGWQGSFSYGQPY